MKSRTSVQQELMRQQIIEEERNNKFDRSYNTKSTTFKVSKSSPRNINSIQSYDRNTELNKSVPNRDILSKPFISTIRTQTMDSIINKRQRSLSYSVISEYDQTKHESYSPPMDLAFSNLGNDDALDWNQIEPSITTTSEISQDIIDQITRNQHDTIPESYMETGTEENDSLQDDQSVSSMKPSTSCPANMAHQILLPLGQNIHLNQNIKAAQKPLPNVTSVTGIVEDQKIQWIRDRNKKDCHNRIERKRRDYINNQIQELGQLLPEKLFLSTESKRNKGGILKNSVIYIQQLQQMLTCMHHLQKEAQISENVISAFYKRLQYLENLLTDNGVNFEETGSERATLQQWFNTHQHNSHLLEAVNSIQLSWSSDPDQGEKSSEYGPGYDDVLVKSEDISAESILNSTSISRMQSSNSFTGGNSSGAPSVTNFNSPLSATPSTSMTNNQTNINNNSGSSNRSRATPTSNVSITSVNSPQPRHSLVYGSSQPFTKTGIRLYEHSSKSFISESPVLSSILIGAAGNNSTGKQPQEHSSSTSRQPSFTGLSNSVPDGSRAGFLTQSLHTDNTSNERYYLIPISKSKGIQLMTGNDIKSNPGIIKVDTNLPNNDTPILNRIHSDSCDGSRPRITILNSFSITSSHNDDELQNFIEISPNHNDNEDSLMDEFQFDDIPME